MKTNKINEYNLMLLMRSKQQNKEKAGLFSMSTTAKHLKKLLNLNN